MIKIDVACDATIIIHYGFGHVLVNERDVHNLERKKTQQSTRWLIGFAYMYLAKYILCIVRVLTSFAAIFLYYLVSYHVIFLNLNNRTV